MENKGNKEEAADSTSSLKSDVRRVRTPPEFGLAPLRPLKKSTMDRISKIKSAVLSSKENIPDKSRSPRSRSNVTYTTQDVDLEHKTFVYDGEQITISGDPGCALLNDVHKLVVTHYTKSGDVAMVSKSTQTDADSKADVSTDKENDSETSTRKLVRKDSKTYNAELDKTIHKIRLLTLTSNAPIDDLVESDAVQKLVEGLRSSNTNTQIDAAWALINITAQKDSAPTKHVIDCGGLNELKKLLKSDNKRLVASVVWVLSNIAGDSKDATLKLIQTGILTSVLHITDEQSRYHTSNYRDKFSDRLSRNGEYGDMMRQIAWFYVNICRQNTMNSLPDAITDRVVIAVLLFLQCDDLAIKEDALWALYYLSDNNDNFRKRNRGPDLIFPIMNVCTQLEADVNSQLMAVSLRLVSLYRHYIPLATYNEFDFVNSVNVRFILEGGDAKMQLLVLDVIDWLFYLHGLCTMDELMRLGKGLTLNSIIKCALQLKDNTKQFAEVLCVLNKLCKYLTPDYLDMIRRSSQLDVFYHAVRVILVQAIPLFHGNYKMVEIILAALEQLMSKNALTYQDILPQVPLLEALATCGGAMTRISELAQTLLDGPRM